MSRNTRQSDRELAARSVVRQLRQPAHVIPPLLFPLALLMVNAAGLHSSTKLPGFPTDSFLPFALAVPFIQGALFATLNAGSDLARDIQSGFLNRLALTPMSGVALIAGHLAGVVVLGLMQALRLPRRRARGRRRPRRGRRGGVLLLLSALIALGFGGLGAFVALRTGSGEATQATFPVFFVFLFISSMNTPRNLIDVDWFRYAATANPVSYLIEGVRSLIITGWNGEALALAFSVATVLAIVSVAALRVGAPREADADVRPPVSGRSGSPGACSTRSSRTRRCSPAARLPAVLLHRVRRRPVAGRACARLQLPGRLHGVPVRVRAAAVGGVRRRVHRLRDRRATSSTGSRGGCSSPSRTGPADPRLRDRRARALGW